MDVCDTKDDPAARGSTTTVWWGGLADTLRQSCTDLAHLDARTAALLQRLDEMAACRTLDQIAEFVRSERTFSQAERDYLMSPLLDEIYSSMTCEPLAVQLSAGLVPAKSNALLRGTSTGTDSVSAAPVVVRPECAVAIACMNGYDLALSFLFERGADICKDYSEHILAFGRGVFVDSRELKRAVKPSWRNEPARGTCIHLAGFYGHVQCVEWLLQHGVTVRRDVVVLDAAARQGFDGIVKLLINAGANAKGGYFMGHAGANGHLGTLKLLLAAGADLNEDNAQVLYQAVENRHFAVAKYLLELGADQGTRYYRDALRNAVSTGHPDMVSLLLDSVSFPRDSDIVSIALAGFQVPIAEMLLAAGADVHYNHDEALDTAVRLHPPEVVQMLLSCGAAVNALTTRRPEDSGVAHAASEGKVQTIRLLLDAGGDVNGLGLLVVYSGATVDYPELMDLLQERGLQASLVADARFISVAAAGDDKEVDALLKSIALPEPVRYVALKMAVRNGHRRAVICLLRHHLAAQAQPRREFENFEHVCRLLTLVAPFREAKIFDRLVQLHCCSWRPSRSRDLFCFCLRDGQFGLSHLRSIARFVSQETLNQEMGGWKTASHVRCLEWMLACGASDVPSVDQFVRDRDPDVVLKELTSQGYHRVARFVQEYVQEHSKDF